MSGHRWSGWPGAWCLDCGIEDPIEVAIGVNWYDPYTDTWKDTLEAQAQKQLCRVQRDCPEPGSQRHDPYARHLAEKQKDGL